MGFPHLFTDGVEVLWPRYGHASPQVEERLGEGFQHDFAAPLHKRDPITFPDVEFLPDDSGKRHLAPAADLGYRHGIALRAVQDIF
jgi:hypothetical protein